MRTVLSLPKKRKTCNKKEDLSKVLFQVNPLFQAVARRFCIIRHRITPTTSAAPIASVTIPG